MESEAEETPRTFEVDPYEHMDYLGHGAYGYVDKVREKVAPPRSSRVYARKVVRISSSRDREHLLKSVLNEFKILNRLDHKHIVKVLQIYQWKTCLSIIISQVAEANLAEYLQKMDDMDRDVDNKMELLYQHKQELQAWPICLVQALDYLHEMKIKHKDLKPANILIMQGKVLLADFGISKDLIDEDTTASLGASGDVGTRMYCAPEVLTYNARRGRAADIYSMGCIFLEISTLLLEPVGLRKWLSHKERSGSRLYSASGVQTLQWIAHLWGFVYHHATSHDPHKTIYDSIIFNGLNSSHMAFLMLDPNPKTRITARQLIHMLRTNRHSSREVFQKNVCKSCRIIPDSPNPNLPIHSVFRLENDANFLAHPNNPLEVEFAPNWEVAKRLWLKSHMWW